MAATAQGSSRPSARAADTDPARLPLALGGMGCSKRCAVVGLPDDVLVEILSRLPAKFLCRSKCVSKAWCDLIADRLRCRKLPLTLEGFFCVCKSGLRSEYISEDDEESGSEDDEEEGDEGGNVGKDEKSSRHASCHFINLLGRSVPLVDPLFSFLRKQPGNYGLGILVDSCNGLLLFELTWYTDGIIVYNPATEHWVPVLSSGFTLDRPEYYDSDDDDEDPCVLTYLIFDPAISSHFQLIEFCYNPGGSLLQTIYSSETMTVTLLAGDFWWHCGRQFAK